MTVDPHGSGAITSLGQIEALSNPLRTRILRHSGAPTTVAELADLFDVPTTRLYYHVNQLVAEGMLAQVDERKSGARIEKIYLRTAGSFQLSEGLVEAIGDGRKAAEAAASVIFDATRSEVEDSLERRFAGRPDNGELGRTVVNLTSDQATEFSARIGNLMTEILNADVQPAEQTVAYSFTVAFVPVDVNGETQ